MLLVSTRWLKNWTISVVSIPQVALYKNNIVFTVQSIKVLTNILQYNKNSEIPCVKAFFCLWPVLLAEHIVDGYSSSGWSKLTIFAYCCQNRVFQPPPPKKKGWKVICWHRGVVVRGAFSVSFPHQYFGKNHNFIILILFWPVAECSWGLSDPAAPWTCFPCTYKLN